MPSDERTESGGGPHVLVIEDDPIFSEALRVGLSRGGFRVTLTSNGQEGVQQAIAGRFDIILLDLMMPEMGGEEVLRALRPLGLRSRIVVLSAHADARWQDAVNNLGAAATLEKPVSLGVLVRLLRQMTAAGASDGEGGADVGGSRVWSGLLRVGVAGPEGTPGRKVVGLGIVAGMGALILWTLFGRRL